MSEPAPATNGVRWERTLLAGLLLALAVFLLLQQGNPIDEVEHLHVAWLMTMRGQRPIHDFFEHHFPLFWYLLAPIFRLGLDGPEALYAARALVVALAGAYLFGLARLQQGLSGSARFGAPISFAAFAMIASLDLELIVARPETLASGLFGLAAWAQTSRLRPIARELLAGFLGGLSAMASPRFALLAPALLWLVRPGALGEGLARRALALAAGGLAACALCVATILPWEDLRFDLEFSALLQQVGRHIFIDMRFLAGSISGLVMCTGVALALHQAPRRRELLVWLAHALLVGAVCLHSSGNFFYLQAIAPLLMMAPLFIAWVEAHPPSEAAEAVRPKLRGTVLGSSLALVMVMLGLTTTSMYGLLAMTGSRRLLLDLLPPDSRVLVLTSYHPIAIEDSSYWGAILINDTQGHICLAAEAWRAAHPGDTRLPRCSLRDELRDHPPVVASRDLAEAALPQEILAVRGWLARNYASIPALNDAPNLSFPAQLVGRVRPKTDSPGPAPAAP